MKNAARLVLCAWMGGVLASGQEPWSRNFCFEKTDPPRLEVEIRWNTPIQMTGATARAGAQALPVQFTPFGESDEGKMAVLFLIDKSDPKRGRTIEAAKALVLRLIESTDARAIAISAFDSELVTIADFGVARDDLAARLKPLKPTGMATELYSNVIEGVRILERSPIRRRVMVLLSDGKAEDTTYTLEQAVVAAAKGSVTILGVGYAETPQGTVHLQSLRRLAAETTGPFAEADIGTKKVPERFVEEFLPILSAGGFATVDMKGVQAAEITCEWLTAAHPPAVVKIPLNILAPAAGDKRAGEMASTVQQVAKKVEELAKAGEAAKKTEEARRAAEQQAAQTAAEERNRLAAEAEEQRLRQRMLENQERKKRLLLIGAGVLLALLLASIALVHHRRQRAGALAAAATAPVFARLQVLDGDGTEHLMRTTALRLGRGKDNDLTLGNDSVSRHHAEISRTREGTFTITELNAGNGVLVNGAEVGKATLNHEDIIELGEVRIRFLIA